MKAIDSYNKILNDNSFATLTNEIKRYFVDFVFCIDASSKMAPLLNNIKDVMVNLYNRAMLDSKFS